jgi:hypothetical protein
VDDKVYELSEADKAAFFRDFRNVTPVALRWCMKVLGPTLGHVPYRDWGSLGFISKYSYVDEMPHQCGMDAIETDIAWNLPSLVCTLLHCIGSRRYLIATFNERQTQMGIFEQAGFKRKCAWKTNPNTGNKVALYMFTLNSNWAKPEERSDW